MGFLAALCLRQRVGLPALQVSGLASAAFPDWAPTHSADSSSHALLGTQTEQFCGSSDNLAPVTFLCKDQEQAL